jgi:hypothetical protein
VTRQTTKHRSKLPAPQGFSLWGRSLHFWPALLQIPITAKLSSAHASIASEFVTFYAELIQAGSLLSLSVNDDGSTQDFFPQSYTDALIGPLH